jgi:hypothetical protein
MAELALDHPERMLDLGGFFIGARPHVINTLDLI